jgi:molecular chaperone GrpE (heat shock protein)
MSGVANPASDIIIVMGDDPDGSGGGYHRPQRKRVRTTKVLEMEQKNGDMEWQEEGETSEGARKQTAPKSAGGMVEAVQSLKQLLEQDLNKKIEAMKAEFQLEFTKLSDRMAEEVARATAQMAQELSQVRDQLTQVCGELE